MTRDSCNRRTPSRRSPGRIAAGRQPFGLPYAKILSMRLDLPFGCLAATALSAWLPGQELPTYPRLDLMVPRGLTDVHYGRSVVADMSGHHLPDVVVLATGTDAQNQNVRTALFASAPALH